MVIEFDFAPDVLRHHGAKFRVVRVWFAGDGIAAKLGDATRVSNDVSLGAAARTLIGLGGLLGLQVTDADAQTYGLAFQAACREAIKWRPLLPLKRVPARALKRGMYRGVVNL